jgi:hypothetical protein
MIGMLKFVSIKSMEGPTEIGEWHTSHETTAIVDSHRHRKVASDSNY